jgi:hypothetical protein
MNTDVFTIKQYDSLPDIISDFESISKAPKVTTNIYKYLHKQERKREIQLNNNSINNNNNHNNRNYFQSTNEATHHYINPNLVKLFDDMPCHNISLLFHEDIFTPDDDDDDDDDDDIDNTDNNTNTNDNDNDNDNHNNNNNNNINNINNITSTSSSRFDVQERKDIEEKQTDITTILTHLYQACMTGEQFGLENLLQNESLLNNNSNNNNNQNHSHNDDVINDS